MAEHKVAIYFLLGWTTMCLPISVKFKDYFSSMNYNGVGTLTVGLKFTGFANVKSSENSLICRDLPAFF